MPIQETDFAFYDPDHEYEDTLVYDDDGTIVKEKDPLEPRAVYCCKCNTANSWCIPEQTGGMIMTTAAAQTLAFWFGG